MDLNTDDIIYANPFFQHKTVKQRGCQIDYMIQTRHQTLYICEIKFSRDILATSIIDEVKEKIARLTIPKNMSCLPVLIHMGGVSDRVIEQRYFAKVIDFAELIN